MQEAARGRGDRGTLQRIVIRRAFGLTGEETKIGEEKVYQVELKSLDTSHTILTVI
jgi:hypothetical protein